MTFKIYRRPRSHVDMKCECGHVQAYHSHMAGKCKFCDCPKFKAKK